MDPSGASFGDCLQHFSDGPIGGRPSACFPVDFWMDASAPGLGGLRSKSWPTVGLYFSGTALRQCKDPRHGSIRPKLPPARGKRLGEARLSRVRPLSVPPGVEGWRSKEGACWAVWMIPSDRSIVARASLCVRPFGWTPCLAGPRIALGLGVIVPSFPANGSAGGRVRQI